jgi:hypothetical protein
MRRNSHSADRGWCEASAAALDLLHRLKFPGVLRLVETTPPRYWNNENCC